MNAIYNDIMNKKQYQNINIMEGGVRPTFDRMK